MRKLLITAAVTALMLVVAAPASADDRQRTFGRDVRATGWFSPSVSDDQIITNGLAVCNNLIYQPASQIVDNLVANGALPVRAQTFVNLAIRDLCPQAGW